MMPSVGAGQARPRTDARMSWLAIGVLIAFAAPIYGYDLANAPIYLHHDELQFAVQAESIVRSWRDLNGHVLPLYFQTSPGVWFQPMLFYWLAAAFTVLPVSGTVIRGAVVVVGLVNITLIYFVAMRLFRSIPWALVTAGFLLLTPAHFIHSRLAMDYLCPVPFALGWLLCMIVYLETKRPRALAAAMLLLGIGFYSYLAAVVLMPLYAAMTIVTIWLTSDASRAARVRAIGLAAAAIAIPLSGVVLWLATHPTMYSDFVSRYKVYPSSLNPAQGAREFFNYTSVTERVYLYWEYFNPSYFFFSGASNIVHATRKAGVFPFAFAILLPFGFFRMITRRPSAAESLILAGFLTSPMAALLVDETGAIDRELVLLPFAVLVAVHGLRDMAAARKTLVRGAAVLLTVSVAVQFYFFAADYHLDYRIRSIDWFERNVRGGIEAIIERASRSDVPRIYLSEGVPFVDLNWRFYLLEHRREDLLPRARVVDVTTLNAAEMPPGSIVFASVAEPAVNALLASGDLRKTDTIGEPTGVASFVLASR
jgi:4-amino-4-deoxy-L-arabinose transferase-like glycosyltransferase